MVSTEFTVLGFARRQGTYEGKPYDNYVFYVYRDPMNSDEHGQICDIIKVRADLFRDSSFPDIGDKVTPFYDRFGRCQGFL